MKLYHGIPSVCSIKARIALAEIGLEYESVEMNLQAGDQMDPAYLKLNPNAVVPTLVDGALVVIESSLIIEYLDREYNQSRLMPKGREAEVAARLWLLRCIDIHAAINTLSFSTAMRDKILANTSPDGIQAMLARMPNAVARMKRAEILEKGIESGYLEQALVTMKRCFRDMEQALGQGDWVSGQAFGLPDIALISYVDRVERLGFEAIFANDTPRVADWLKRMQARDSYQVEVAGKIAAEDAAKSRDAGSKYAGAIKAAFDSCG